MTSNSQTTKPVATLRVGMLCPYSLSLPGGVQTQVLGIAKALRQQNVDVRVLGPCDGPPPDTGVTPLGNSLPTAANGSIAPIAPEPAAQLRTIRALREERFDLLHLHEPMVPGPTLTSLFLKGSPVLGTFHAAGESAGYRWLQPVLRQLANRIDKRCAVSQDARLLAQKHLGGNYTVLFNGIDTTLQDNVQPWPTQAPTIFFLARHEHRKGLDILLRATAEMSGDFIVWVGGEGSDTTKLYEAYKTDNRIQWLGRLSAEEKRSRLRGADVFCAPSLGGESFGVVLLEAMLAGTAIVASDLASYARVAEHNKHSVLVPRGDVKALAKALEETLTSASLRDELIQNGSKRVEDFSMLRLAQSYVEIYQELL